MTDFSQFNYSLFHTVKGTSFMPTDPFYFMLNRTIHVQNLAVDLYEDFVMLMAKRCGEVVQWKAAPKLLRVAFASMNSMPAALSLDGITVDEKTIRVTNASKSANTRLAPAIKASQCTTVGTYTGMHVEEFESEITEEKREEILKLKETRKAIAELLTSISASKGRNTNSSETFESNSPNLNSRSQPYLETKLSALNKRYNQDTIPSDLDTLNDTLPLALMQSSKNMSKRDRDIYLASHAIRQVELLIILGRKHLEKKEQELIELKYKVNTH